MEKLFIIVIIVLLDIVFGDPPIIPHPVRFIGKVISFFDKMIRKVVYPPSKISGFILWFLSVSTVLIAISLLLYVTNIINPILKKVLVIYLLYASIACKCLGQEAKKIYLSLKENDINKARKELSYIVGRDTKNLNREEIIRADIETVAENTIDGVLAPLFYIFMGMLFNIPVQVVYLYKTINTLDSMVGYINEPYREIGFASAKIDDLANYFIARIGSFFMILAGGLLYMDIKNSIKILIRDRKNHKSPNCGYPESAVAGLLNIQLGGTNSYFGKSIYKPTIGNAKGNANNMLLPEHILDSIKIMYLSEILMLFIYITILLIF